jgi:hypothetical protein
MAKLNTLETILYLFNMMFGVQTDVKINVTKIKTITNLCHDKNKKF